MADVLTGTLSSVDAEVDAAIARELDRQQSTLEMIASENFAPTAVMAAQGSVLTNKYAEGYPGKRYYGGCEHVDVIEQLAIDRVKALFGAEAANVQPHSGAQANAAAMFALLNPGDTILGLDLAHGGHLTHGMRINFSGKLYNVVPYHVRESDMTVDMAEVEALALEHRPKLIVAGWSAYTRQLDFAEFRRIADLVDAYLMVDMAHFAGLVAAGLHPNPVPYADVVTTTTHKTLGGPRGGVILSRESLATQDQLRRFPRPAGRPAGTRDRGQGRVLQDRRKRGLQGPPAAHPGRGQDPGRAPAAPRRRRIRDLRGGRRHRRPPGPGGPAQLRTGRAAGRGPPAPDRHHREPQRRPVRPPPADGLLRPADRHPGPGHPRLRRRPNSPRSPTSSPRPSRANSATSPPCCSATGSPSWPRNSRFTRTFPATPEPPRTELPSDAPNICRSTPTSCGATRTRRSPTTP